MNRLFRLILATLMFASKVAVSNPILWDLVQKAKHTEPNSVEWKAVHSAAAAEVNIDLAFSAEPGGPTLKQVLSETDPELLAKIEAATRLCDGYWLQVSSACGTPRKGIAWRRVEGLLKGNHDHRWLRFRPSDRFVSAGCLMLIYNPRRFSSFLAVDDKTPHLWSDLVKAVVEGGPSWNRFLKKARNEPSSLHWRTPTGESILEIVRVFKPAIYDQHFKFPSVVEANYENPCILSAGAGGFVWQAIRCSDKLVVAVKCIRKAQIEEWMLTWPPAEATLQKSLEHPHLLSLLDFVPTDNAVYLVTECMPGEFFNYVMEKDHLLEPECRDFMGQILSAVDYMHQRKICHRDLKLENMLLDKDGKIKIADFGFACEFGEEELTLPCGSPDYLPPEILNQESYIGSQVDIWALGVGFVAMATGYVPFSSDENAAALKYVFRIPVSAAFATLIAGIFRYADARFTMADILKSAFMTVASNDKLK